LIKKDNFHIDISKVCCL